MVRDRVAQYFLALHRTIRDVQCTDREARLLSVDAAFGRAAQLFALAGRSNKIMFVGNGGSAAIASHMAIDFCKNGRMRAVALNDSAALTCIGNDFGYEDVFAKQVEFQAFPGDVLVAISSSGRSENIRRGVDAGRAKGCDVVTFSGFGMDNPLRGLGDVNFYLDASEYGFVEVGHLALVHAILDMMMSGSLTGEIEPVRLIAAS